MLPLRIKRIRFAKVHIFFGACNFSPYFFVCFCVILSEFFGGALTADQFSVAFSLFSFMAVREFREFREFREVRDRSPLTP